MWFRTMGRGGRWGSGGIWRMGGVRVDEGRRRCCLPLLMTSFPVVVSCSCYSENLGKTAVGVNCTGSLILFCSYIWDLFLVLCSIYIYFLCSFYRGIFFFLNLACVWFAFILIVCLPVAPTDRPGPSSTHWRQSWSRWKSRKPRL